MPTKEQRLTVLFSRAGVGENASGLGTYRRLAEQSALPSGFIGMFGVLFPPISLLGIRAALRARRAGSRFSWMLGVVWCLATAVGGVFVWMGGAT